MSRYSEIQIIKNIFIADKINWGSVLATELYNESFFYFGKIMIDTFFKERNINFKKRNSSILVFHSNHYKRNDYEEIVRKFKNKLDSYDTITITEAYSFNMRGIASSLRSCLLNISKLNGTKLKLSDRLRIAILMTKYNNFLKDIELIINSNNYKAMVTFCDAHPMDNLITQLCNKISVKTLTLQHGQYRYLKKGLETADAEAYKNFISDYLLSWGQATKDEFTRAGIPSNRILNAGALKDYNRGAAFDINSKPKNIFGVILDGETYKKSNIRLLNIAQIIARKYNMNFIVRLHPKNKLRYYQKYVKNDMCIEWVKSIGSTEYINKVDFSILHMTGVYVELLSYSAPFFVFKDEYTEELFTKRHLMFEDLEGFVNVYEDYLNNKNEFCEKQLETYKYFDENARTGNHYKKLIEQILKNSF